VEPIPLAEKIEPVLLYLDWAAVAVFAVSGALVAAVQRRTLVTFLFFAVVTGVGGGTVRDLLIGAPVFWIEENATLLICFAAGTLVWFLPARIWRGKALLWFDAAGLAAYGTYGAAKGIAYGVAPLPAIGMGVLILGAGGRAADGGRPEPDRGCHRRKRRLRPARRRDLEGVEPSSL
jgi:uncharacterized membrane protein YeiH